MIYLLSITSSVFLYSRYLYQRPPLYNYIFLMSRGGQSIRVDSCSSFVQLQQPLKPGPSFQNNLLITARFFSDLPKSQSQDPYRALIIVATLFSQKLKELQIYSDDVRNKKSTYCYQLCFWWYCYLDE